MLAFEPANPKPRSRRFLLARAGASPSQEMQQGVGYRFSA
jgi:hypothetical protein